MSDVPADLVVLRQLAAAGKELPFPGVMLLDEQQAADVPDTSYLNDADRQNLDIMGNMAAIQEVAALVTWVARSEESEEFGYWHGPEGLALSESPIVRYDTEGQFELLGGRSLAEALCGGLAWGADFEEYAEACRAIGLEIEGDDPDELPIPEVATEPAELHQRRYREKTGYTG